MKYQDLIHAFLHDFTVMFCSTCLSTNVTVLKVVSGGIFGIYDFYMNKSMSGMLGPHFKSNIINDWNSVKVREVTFQCLDFLECSCDLYWSLNDQVNFFSDRLLSVCLFVNLYIIDWFDKYWSNIGQNAVGVNEEENISLFKWRTASLWKIIERKWIC